MSFAPGAAALGVMLAGTAPAAAQMYPGQDVTVNPGAVGSPGSLVYPGGLLPPGATSRGLPPVHLHPPKEHYTYNPPAAQAPRVAEKPPQPVQEAKSEPAPPPESEPEEQSAPPAPVIRAKPKPAPVKEAKAEPVATPPAPAPEPEEPAPHKANAIPFSLSEPGEAPPPAAKHAPSHESAPPAERTASIAPPARKTSPIVPKITLDKGLSKQAAILFDSGSSDLSQSSTARLNDLAFSLKTALANGADHIELVAYAGAPGDKSSSARRLSLRRALAVREALIVAGVPPVRIDVRALGGVTDNGATDRVDIFVKA